MKRHSFLTPAPTPRSLPATTKRSIPRRITPEDAARIVSEDLDLTGDILSSIAQAIFAAIGVGTITVASGSNWVFNALGAGTSLAAMAPIVNILRKKRAWETLTLIERANNQDTEAAIFAALAERAIQYQEKGITVMQSAIGIDADDEMYALPPGQAQEFAPQSFETPAYEEYELDEEIDRTISIARSAPMAMTQASASPAYQPTILVKAPEFKNLRSPTANSNGEFPLDDIAKFRCLVWIKGAKGSGKTSKVTHVEKCRHDLGQAVWRIDPMPPQADLRRRRGIALYGAQENWEEIEFAVSEFNKLAKARLDRRGRDPDYDPESEQHVNLSIDEGAVLCKITKSVLEEFWLDTVVRRIRQANMSVTIGTHGETKRFLGMTNDDGFTGLIDALKEDAILVQGHTLDSRVPQPFADIIYQGKTWRVDCSHVLPHENVEFIPHSKPASLPQTTPIAQPKTLSSQPMLSLAPGGIHDDRAAVVPEVQIDLPVVRHHELQFEGMQSVTITEPPILKLLEVRADLRAIVRALIDWGGTAEARTVQAQRQCKALQFPSGKPYNSEAIATLMGYLADEYSEYFAFDDKTLTATNDEVLTWQLRK